MKIFLSIVFAAQIAIAGATNILASSARYGIVEPRYQSDAGQWYAGTNAGLIGWLPLTSTASNGIVQWDAAKYGLDASATNALYAPAMLSNGLFFNGTNSISFPDSGILKPTNVACACWIFLTRNFSNNNASVIFEHQSGTPYFGWTFAGLSVSNGNKLFVDAAYNLNSVEPYSNTSLSVSNWYHVGFTYDGVTIRIMVDGTQDIAQAASGSLTYTTQAPTTMGSKSGQPLNLNLFAIVRDICIWCCAPTTSVFSTLYSAGHP